MPDNRVRIMAKRSHKSGNSKCRDRLELYPSLSVQQHRIQLQARFVDLFDPVGTGSTFCEAIGVGQALLDRSLPACVAADALCILQVGLTYSDDAFLRQYTALYCKALGLLADSIARAHPVHMQLTPAYILGICEYQHHSAHGDTRWLIHGNGMTQIFSRSLTFFSTATWPGYARFWRFMLNYGFTVRLGILPQSWLLLRHIDDNVDPVTAASLRVPGWLAKLDHFHLHDPGSNKCTQAGKNVRMVMKGALNTRKNILSALDLWASEDFPNSYITVDRVSAFGAFSKQCGKLRIAFPCAYRFQTQASAKIYRTAWISLLLLDQALLRSIDDLTAFGEHGIKQDLPEFADVLQLSSTTANLRAECLECARNLSQSLAYMMLPVNKAIGTITAVQSLYFLEEYYELQGRGLETAWCQQLSRAISPQQQCNTSKRGFRALHQRP